MARCSFFFFVYYSGSYLAAWLLSILLCTSSNMENHSESEESEETKVYHVDQGSYPRVCGQNLTEYEEREKVGLVF